MSRRHLLAAPAHPPHRRGLLRAVRQHDPGQHVSIVLVPPGQHTATTLDVVLADRPQ